MPIENLLIPPLPKYAAELTPGVIGSLSQLKSVARKEFEGKKDPKLIRELRKRLSYRVLYSGIPRDEFERINEQVIDILLLAVDPFISGDGPQARLNRAKVDPNYSP